MLGDYYYSQDKILLNTVVDKELPNPETILNRGKNYLKESNKL